MKGGGELAIQDIVALSRADILAEIHIMLGGGNNSFPQKPTNFWRVVKLWYLGKKSQVHHLVVVIAIANSTALL